MADEMSQEVKDAQREFASIISQLSNQYKDVAKETAAYEDALQDLRVNASKIAVAQQALTSGQQQYKNASGKLVNTQQSLDYLLKTRLSLETNLNTQLRQSIVTVGELSRIDKEQMSLAKQEMAIRQAKMNQEVESKQIANQLLATQRKKLIDDRGINTDIISAEQGLIAGIGMYSRSLSNQINSNAIRTEFLNDEFKNVASQLKQDYNSVSSGLQDIKDTDKSLAENARRILVARQALQRGDAEYINASGKLVNVENSLDGLLRERIGLEENYHNNMTQRLTEARQLLETEKATAAAEKEVANAAQRKSAAMDALKTLLTKLGQAIINLTDRIYEISARLSVQLGSATQVYAQALMSSIKSLLPGTTKTILKQDDIINAYAGFKSEFGTILAGFEAEKIADEAKLLGVSAQDYVRAKRAFLGTGAAEDAVRQRAINQFKSRGMAASEAIQFAANNADLLAVAGDKYADSLFRAAAESKKIGVNLRDVEKFANSIVGDFESSLENFAELSALGVEMDFNQLAQVAATGTPEEMQNLLKEQLSMSGITGEELQRNRQVRLALTQTTGLDEATILRLSGVAQQPAEKTVPEKQLGTLEEILRTLNLISKIGLGIAGAMTLFRGVQTVRQGLPQLLGRTTLPATPLTPSPAAVSSMPGGARLGGGIGAAAGLIGGITTLFDGGGWKKAILMTIAPILGGVLGGVLGTALVTALAATGVGAPIAAAIGPSLIATMSAAGATLAGVAVSKFMGEGKAQGGLITGPGTSTSDNILTPSSPGEFVVNAKATQAYGSDMLNKINTGTYTPEKQIVTNNTKIDTTRLEEKLDKLINRVSGMKVEMNGYEVGHVSFNEARTPLRVR